MADFDTGFDTRLDIIKSLCLKNFGPWEDQKIEFHPGVNVIVGDSDGGKSAILKGLDFILNDTTPKSADGNLGFITRPLERGKFAENTVELIHNSETHKITRRKGKSVNEYQLNNDEPQKANNRTIPEHIKKIINTKPVNYHKQSEPPFLVSDLPSAVAKQLAEVINLEEIDTTVSFAMSCVRENKKTAKLKEENLEKMLTELGQLKYVQKFKAEIDCCSELETKYNKISLKFNEIDNIFCVLSDLKKEQCVFESIAGLKSNIFEVENIERDFQSKAAKISSLRKILENIKTLKAKNTVFKKIIKISEQIKEFEAACSDFDNLDNKFIKIEDCIVEINALRAHGERNKLLLGMQPLISDCNAQISDFDALTAKYNSVLLCAEKITEKTQQNNILEKEIKKMKSELNGVACPTCGQKIDNIDNIDGV